MNIPKISVIIPIYDVEGYLEETLDNMLNQTFIDDMEILMIDDGSNDDSRYIVEKYALDYENFHAFHKENAGQCVARNLALLIARGEYIHFMDSDDFITYDSYEKLYNFAKRGDYDVVTFNYLRFDDNRTWKVASQLDVFDELTGDIENTNIFDFKELSWDMTNCNKIVKKELLDKNNIRYYYRNIIYEDNLFWIEVYINAKKIGVIKEYMYFWRYRENLSSTTQNRDLDLGKRFSEMVSIVNEFITNNISDKKILGKKYEKLLSINLYFFIQSVLEYPKEYQKNLFNDVYNMLQIVPKEFLNNLNSYFKVLYEIIGNKDWDTLIIFLSYNFKTNPYLPNDLNQNYAKKLDFKNDSHFEKLDSSVINICAEDNNLVIESKNFVPYNPINNYDKIDLKLLSKDNGVLLDSQFIDNNKIFIPFNLIPFGESNLLTSYFFDDIKKESFMKTSFNKSFIFDDFDIYIKRGPNNQLRLIKRGKNDINIKIDNIRLSGGKLIFSGISDDKFDNVFINDFLGIVELSYPINYYGDNNFSFEIDYYDFLKAPIPKWLISLNGLYNNISVSKPFEFLDKRHKISIMNHDATIFIEFELFNGLEMLHDLSNENKNLRLINNSLSNINNKLISLLPELSEVMDLLWDDQSNSKKTTDYSIFNEKSGVLTIVDDYKQLEVFDSNPTVVRVFSGELVGDFEIILEVKVTDYGNIGISNSENIVNFAFLRISNNDWLHYRFLKIDDSIFIYVSENGKDWDEIKLTGNTLNSDGKYQFQFNCGYSNSYNKKVMIRNLRIYSI